MSEFELSDAIATYMELAQNSFANYIAVISGYLLTAYLLGAKLTRAQVGLVSILFIAIVYLAASAAFGSMMRAHELSLRLEGLDPEYESRFSMWKTYAMAAFMAAAAGGALKFMWDIRHPTTAVPQ